MQIDGAIMTLGNENNSTGSCMGNINAKGLIPIYCCDQVVIKIF